MADLTGKVYFIGAGPGDPELLTLKGKRILEQANLIIYADSLVNRAVCDFAQRGAEIRQSSASTLEEMVEAIAIAVEQGKIVARLHTGDPAIFGATFEQMRALDARGIAYEIVPGVSSVFAAAATLKAELTVPEVSQTVILTRREGRTPVPGQQGLRGLAQHSATMGIFLSVGMIDDVVAELMAGGYAPDTPVAVVQCVSWENERIVRGSLADIAQKVHAESIERQALILVGEALGCREEGLGDHRSRLYDGKFSHGYRRGQAPENRANRPG